MPLTNIILFIITYNIFETIISRINNGHGILITLIGLLAVFCGLIVLWVVTSNFHRLIKKIEVKSNKETSIKPYSNRKSTEIEREDLEEIATAIGVALCYELEEEEMSVITLRHIEQEMSPWIVASKPTTMRH